MGFCSRTGHFCAGTAIPGGNGFTAPDDLLTGSKKEVEVCSESKRSFHAGPESVPTARRGAGCRGTAPRTPPHCTRTRRGPGVLRTSAARVRARVCAGGRDSSAQRAKFGGGANYGGEWKDAVQCGYLPGARRGADVGAGDHRDEIAGAGGREGFSWLDREVTRLCAGTAGPLLARAAHYASTLALINASLRVTALAAHYPIGHARARAPRRERARRRGAR